MEALALIGAIGALYLIAKLIIILFPAILASTSAVGTGFTAYEFSQVGLQDDLTIAVTASLVAGCLVLVITAMRCWRQAGVDLRLVEA